jgi:hypothetical protein
MKRLLAAALLTACAFGAPAAHAAGPLDHLGGYCDGLVDVNCRTHVCQPDELDCGLTPPCFVWVAGLCFGGG